MKILVPLSGLVVLLSIGCNGPKTGEKDKEYVMESKGCDCKETFSKMGKTCKCNHCLGQTGAKCYCGMGQPPCGCGEFMPGCQCDHCKGKAGETKCPCLGGW
jgi:hypothetical protein